MDQEHDDYVEKDLPPPWRPAHIEVILTLLGVAALFTLIAFGVFMSYLMQFAK